MKLAIPDNQLAATLVALKAIASGALAAQTFVYVTSKAYAYIYWPDLSQAQSAQTPGAVAPDDQADDTGWWLPDLKANLHIPVIDAYNFAGNSATDVSSIALWNYYIDNGGIACDYAAKQEAIRALREAAGYGTLSETNKKICLRHFAAGTGVNYVDALYTDAEYEAFMLTYRTGMRESYAARHEKVSKYLTKLVMKGDITKPVASRIAKSTAKLRDLYVRDLIDGSGYGDETPGIRNWLQNTDVYASIALVDHINSSKIQVAGDARPIVNGGVDMQIINASVEANNTMYTIKKVTYDEEGNTTTIKHDGTCDTSVNDGDLLVAGYQSFDPAEATIAIRDEIETIYLNG